MAPLADSSRPNQGLRGQEKARRVLRSRTITMDSELGQAPPRPKSSGPFISRVHRVNRPENNPTDSVGHTEEEQNMNVEKHPEETSVASAVESVECEQQPQRSEAELLQESQELLEKAKHLLNEADNLQQVEDPNCAPQDTKKSVFDSMWEGLVSGTTATVDTINSGVNRVNEKAHGILSRIGERSAHYHDKLMGGPINPETESTSAKVLLTVGAWGFTVITGTSAIITNGAQKIVVSACSGIGWIIAAIFATGFVIVDTMANMLVKVKNALAGKQYTEQQKGDDVEFCVA